MGTTTLRPDSTISSSNVVAVGGAGTLHGVTSDNSDASYVDTTGFGATAFLGLSTFAFPSLSQIRSVTPRVRLSSTGGAIQTQYSISNGPSSKTLNNVTPTGIATFTGAAENTNFSGAAWSQSDIDSLQLKVAMVGDDWFYYEGYVDVVYNEAPVATVTAPGEGSTVTSTSPTVGWSYVDPEFDTQERYQVKIFSAAQYGIGGFDPETSPYTWWSDEVLSAINSVVVGAILVQGTTYRAYVKVADSGSGGRYGLWDNNTFTVQSAITGSAAAPGVGPAVPTLSATNDNINARVALLLALRDNLLTFNQSSLETDLIGWAVDANCTLARATAQFLDGSASLQLTSVAAGNMTAATPLGASALHRVTAGAQYTALASFRSAVSARNCLVSIFWYTAAGAAATTANNDSATVADTTAGWTQASVTATAPANAAFAAVKVTVQATAAAAEVHYVDRISLAPGNSTTWSPGGFVSGRNLLTENQARIEGLTTGWAVGGNCTLSSSVLQKFEGSSSLALTAVAAATMSATTLTGLAAVPVTVGQQYAASAQVLANTTGRTVTIAITWVNAAGAVISTVTSANFTDTNATWTRLYVAGIAPALAVYAYITVTVTSPGAGEIHYVDRVMFCAGCSDLWINPTESQRRWITLERSNDGVVWATIARPIPTNPDVNLVQASETLYDYEANLNVIQYYRAKVSVNT